MVHLSTDSQIFVWHKGNGYDDDGDWKGGNDDGNGIDVDGDGDNGDDETDVWSDKQVYFVLMVMAEKVAMMMAMVTMLMGMVTMAMTRQMYGLKSRCMVW